MDVAMNSPSAGCGRRRAAASVASTSGFLASSSDTMPAAPAFTTVTLVLVPHGRPAAGRRRALEAASIFVWRGPAHVRR